MTLWTPPGADLGEHAGPDPDPRMRHFIGGPDEHGQPVPMTFQRRRAHTDTWPVTQATPEGPATLLKVARDMFAHGFYVYEFVAASCAWSLFAVEAALKLRLEKRADLKTLIQLAEERGLIRSGSGEIVDAGRQIRNRLRPRRQTRSMEFRYG